MSFNFKLLYKLIIHIYEYNTEHREKNEIGFI